jgi:hypothetical protein
MIRNKIHRKGGDSMNRKIKAIVTGILVLIGASCASAGTFDETQARRGAMEPPPQAYEACNGKNEGDSVKITTPWGETITAICKQINGKLAAMPEGGVREPRNNPDR